MSAWHGHLFCSAVHGSPKIGLTSVVEVEGVAKEGDRVEVDEVQS